MSAPQPTSKKNTTAGGSPRRGRKRIILMALITAFVYTAGDRALVWVLWKTPTLNGAGRAWRDQEYLANNRAVRELLIIGDSRVKWTLDPWVLTPAGGVSLGHGLNIAQPGTFPGDDAAMVRWLDGRGYLADTKVLIWGIGLDRFYERTYGSENTYLLYDPWARGKNFAGLTDYLSRQIAPALTSRGSLRQVLANRDRIVRDVRDYSVAVDYQKLGFLRNDKPARPNVSWGPLFAQVKVTPEARGKVMESVRTLRARGVRVILLETPLSPRLTAYFRNEKASEWKTYRQLLSDAEQAGAEVWLSDDHSFAAEEYSDPVHLIAPAAELYQKSIKARLK